MKKLFNFVIHQIVTVYIGSTILLIFYKLKGQQVTYTQILNEVNPKTGLKKYTYKAFYLGIVLLIILVVVLSTMFGLNPKIYSLNI